MGGHSQCWGDAGAAPSLSGPFHPPAPPTTLPFARDKVTSLFTAPEALPLHHSPHTAPFYSQGRVTLAATSQAWEEPTRSSRKPQPALCHIQGVDPWNCSFCTSGLVWGFNRWRENFQARRLCPHQLLSTQTWSDVEEVSQVLLRGGSRLGRAASHRARRGGGTCSRWPR